MRRPNASMKVLRATHLGMCFGVRRAIAQALAEAHRQPLTVLGELVHNETVLAGLRTQGVRTVQQISDVATGTVMITAHGASDRTISQLRALGLRVVEATCPLVRRVHRAVRQLVATGYHPVIIGQRQHVEVRGLTEDLTDYDVVLQPEDIVAMAPRPRFGVVAQTTQPSPKVLGLVALLRRRFPESEVRFIDTVCLPTKQRQQAALRLAQECDVVVVVGGAHSNNTLELVATCRQACGRVHHVQTAADLQPDWFAGAANVGLTAGTSTPDEVITEVEQWLRQWAQGQTEPAHAPVLATP